MLALDRCRVLTTCAWFASVAAVGTVSACFPAFAGDTGAATQSDGAAGEPKEATMATITVSSPAFAPGAAIPRKYSREGDDVSPPLEWTGVPAGTRGLVLIVDDPDAPRDHPWVHWVVYGMPGDTRSLAEGANDAFVQGKTDFGEQRWGGPMPPPGHGVHHYHFKLYALDAPLAAKPGLRKSAVIEAMKGHVVGQGELVGTYERK
jgi:Raf kinase inhibitor-like YbhB/YbcL family protein